MKLTKLYIHNYKSFYDTTIELDKMNIVVGENNSGKSNLIDVLEFIDILLKKDFNQAVEEKGGWEKILNYNYDEKNIIIKFYLEGNQIIDCEKPPIEARDIYKSVKLTINKNLFHITVFENAYIVNDDFGDISTLISTKIYLNSLKIKEKLSFKKENEIITTNGLKALTETEPAFKRYIECIEKLASNFKFTITYAFNTETIRNKSHRKATIELKKDGSNLGKNLFNIKNNYPNTFELISNSMIGIVNEIDAVDVQDTFGNYNLGFHEEHKQIGIDMVSDGTINLLATITALHQNDESILLAFDEPERYLHLKAVNYLLENFRASEKQILITTHSTEILKYANLDEIVFIYRDSDGDTQSIRARDIPDLEGKMERLGYERPLTLDELIASNIVGSFE